MQQAALDDQRHLHQPPAASPPREVQAKHCRWPVTHAVSNPQRLAKHTCRVPSRLVLGHLVRAYPSARGRRSVREVKQGGRHRRHGAPPLLAIPAAGTLLLLVMLELCLQGFRVWRVCVPLPLAPPLVGLLLLLQRKDVVSNNLTYASHPRVAFKIAWPQQTCFLSSVANVCAHDTLCGRDKLQDQALLCSH